MLLFLRNIGLYTTSWCFTCGFHSGLRPDYIFVATSKVWPSRTLQWEWSQGALLSLDRWEWCCHLFRRLGGLVQIEKGCLCQGKQGGRFLGSPKGIRGEEVGTRCLVQGCHRIQGVFWWRCFECRYCSWVVIFHTSIRYRHQSLILFEYSW